MATKPPEKPFILFCKTYAGDLLRVLKLWESIQLHNQDHIDFYLCTPQKDRSLFEETFKSFDPHLYWVCDEEIIAAHPQAQNRRLLETYYAWDGRLSQQVIKAEFWRYLLAKNITCDAYLCLDSESIFVKDFFCKDFFHSTGVPLTVMHDNLELLDLAERKKISKVKQLYLKESSILKEVFSRSGEDYDFGPTPVIWSPKVWSDLDSHYLTPRGLTLWDAIQARPSELRWYGEALLAFQSMPIYPVGPLFRVYHYNWQYYFLKKQGEKIEALPEHYLGYLKQSNWTFEEDFGEQRRRKSWGSRALRKLKRLLAYFR